MSALEANLIVVQKYATERDALRIEAERLANVDQLTGVRNRRAWYAEAEQAGHTAVAIFDIDHFKRVNDRYGHPVGDLVLQEVATRLEAALEGHGTMGRLGGEEFAAVFSIPLDEAHRVCVDAVAAVAGAPVDLPSGGKLEVTISAGLAGWRHVPDDSKASLEATYEEADGALYHAKQSGRGRLSIGRRRHRAA